MGCIFKKKKVGAGLWFLAACGALQTPAEDDTAKVTRRIPPSLLSLSLAWIQGMDCGANKTWFTDFGSNHRHLFCPEGREDAGGCVFTEKQLE